MLSFIEVSAPGYFLEFFNCFVVIGCYRTNGPRDCLFLVFTRSAYSKCDLKKKKKQVDNKNLQKKPYWHLRCSPGEARMEVSQTDPREVRRVATYKARNMCPCFLLANLLSANIWHCHTSAWGTGIG